MKINFRKISSVLASAVMLGSTVGIAAAAAYPAPFVSGSSSDVALIYGTGTGVSDIDRVAALDISTNLNAALGTSSTAGGAVTTTGETAPLFGGTKLYVNDTLNIVKSVLSKGQLPILLADSTFSGDVDAKITNSITISPSPLVKFDKMPLSTTDPVFGISIGTNAQTAPAYNATSSFSKAINFTHASSEGQDITLFGQKFTVAAETDTTKLVLLKAATKVNLEKPGATSQEVTIGGKKYTVELVSASDTAATIRVTNEAGTSDSREVSEAASKKIAGLTVAVTTADETNQQLSASIVAGAEKITITNGSSVTKGEDDTVIDGSHALIGGTHPVYGAATSIIVSAAAKDSDVDAILAGQALVDPVFGSFKVDFPGMNIADASTSRESIEIRTSGDDKMTVKFTPHGMTEAKTIQYLVENASANPIRTGGYMQIDTAGHNISVFEGEIIYRGDYLVVGNEEDGYLLKLSQVSNQTTGYSSDKIQFSDTFNGNTYDATITAEGSGTVNIGGKEYSVAYGGASSNQDAVSVRVGYPDSTGNDRVIYPTISTASGAKLAFYRPYNIVLNVSGTLTEFNETRVSGRGYMLLGSNLKFPDGDGYTNVAIAAVDGVGVSVAGSGNLSLEDVNITVNGGAFNATQSSSLTATVGRLVYNFTSTNSTFNGGVNVTRVYLKRAANGVNILEPAIVIFEEKDDDSDYEALIVVTEVGLGSDDGVGVADVERTWDGDATAWEYTLSSNSKLLKEADLWGSIITTDSSDSDQQFATISYPNDQIYAQVYVSATDAIVSAGGASSLVPMKDSEVTSTTTKNLIVVGGSCINSVAQRLVNPSAINPVCGADFTAKTGVGAGEFLIETFTSPYAADKVATLVAGYEASDTTNAAKSLTANKPDTTVGKKFKGTTAEGALTAVTA